MKKYSSILDLITTTQDVQAVNNELELLLDSLYKTKQGFEQTLKKSIRIEMAAALQKILKEEKVSTESATNLKNLLENIQKVIVSLPIIQLTIAFSPSQGVIENIHAWIQKNMEKKVLVELTIEPTILAGVVIASNGRYKDYSLKKELDNYFTNKARIAELLGTKR